MNVNQYIILLAGFVCAVMVAFNTHVASSGGVKEGFWGGVSLTTRTMPETIDKQGRVTAKSGSILNQGIGTKFVSVPSFQAVLSPRFDNVGYGANVRYNLPDQKHLASPTNPLTFANMAGGGQENYVPSCGGNNNQMNSVVQASMDTTPNASANVGRTAQLPVATMTSIDMAGDPQQVIVADRYMFANPKSQSWANADLIRGDLAIVPNNMGNWDVHPTISKDLNAGALAVMGGGGYTPTMALINRDSGGTKTTMAGVNFADNMSRVNMANSFDTQLGNSMADVKVTAFP
jgi:hypothetical protein